MSFLNDSGASQDINNPIRGLSIKIRFLEEERARAEDTIADLRTNLRLHKQLLQHAVDGLSSPLLTQLMKVNKLQDARVAQLTQLVQNLRADLLLKEQIQIEEQQFHSQILQSYESRLKQLRMMLIEKENQLSEDSGNLLWDLNKFKQLKRFDQFVQKDFRLRKAEETVRLQMDQLSRQKQELQLARGKLAHCEYKCKEPGLTSLQEATHTTLDKAATGPSRRLDYPEPEVDSLRQIIAGLRLQLSHSNRIRLQCQRRMRELDSQVKTLVLRVQQDQLINYNLRVKAKLLGKLIPRGPARLSPRSRSQTLQQIAEIGDQGGDCQVDSLGDVELAKEYLRELSRELSVVLKHRRKPHSPGRGRSLSLEQPDFVEMQQTLALQWL